MARMSTVNLNILAASDRSKTIKSGSKIIFFCPNNPDLGIAGAAASLLLPPLDPEPV